MYLHLTGAAESAFTLSPQLATPLASLGGNGVGLESGTALTILGPLTSFETSLDEMVIAKFLFNATSLGKLLDLLMAALRRRSALQAKRLHQLPSLLALARAAAITDGLATAASFRFTSSDVTAIDTACWERSASTSSR